MARGGPLGLAIGAGAVVVALAVGVFVAARALGGDAESSGPRANASSAAAGNEGLRAPGTDALRALGCAQATVIDMARLLGDPAKVREDEPRYMVSCDVARADGAPSCDRVAAAYFGAVGGSTDANVSVRVAPAGSTQPVCSRLYAPSGADLGAFPRLGH
jgi:hypothetical protein